MRSVEDRFISRVHETPTCWLWRGAKSLNGYGVFWTGGSRTSGKLMSTHRWIWTYLVGPIPKDKCICHICDVPSCVRLDHLYVGTIHINIEDKLRKNRQGDGGRGVFKVNKENHKTIKKAYQKGISVKELAQEYGVTINTIYRYLKG